MQTLSKELTQFTSDIATIEQNGEQIANRVGKFEAISNESVALMKDVATSLQHVTNKQHESEQLITKTHHRAQSIV